MPRRAATAYEILNETPHSDLEESGERFIERPGLSAAQLEALTAFHANDDGDDAIAETTLSMPPEENRVLVARTIEAFDDDITVEAPVPEIPARTPSPLGDDEVAEPHLPAVIIAPEVSAAALPLMTLMSQEELMSRISGPQTPTVSPELAQAIRDARAVARRVREDEATTRLIVLAIWGAAVVMAGLLALFALVA